NIEIVNDKIFDNIKEKEGEEERVNENVYVTKECSKQEVYDKDYSGIFLDGCDSAEFCPSFVRNLVCAAPQSPWVFSGTLKSNLDPLDMHSDADLTHILRLVCLYDKLCLLHLDLH